MKFRVSSEFGVMEEVRNGRAHRGIDLAMPSGTELRAIDDGIIESIVDYGAENIGKGVIIRLDDGTRAVYGHMSDVSVMEGQSIDAGEIIGLSGNTGHSTGAHLHFGLMKDGEYLDPTPIAEELANISGDLTLLEKASMPFHLSSIHGDLAEMTAKTVAEKWLLATLDVAGTFLGDVIYAVALVGGGILIILKVCGYKDGYRWAGVLFGVNALVRYLFGGAAQ